MSSKGSADPTASEALAAIARQAAAEEDEAARAAEAVDPFVNCGELYELLSSGAVALLAADWVVAFAEGELDALAGASGEIAPGPCLKRRQDLPPEAFRKVDDLFEISRAGERTLCSGHAIIAVSHCWLSPEHPDPTGQQLEKLARYLKAWANAKPGLLLRRLSVFFDWCSLTQRPRSADEERLFQKALRRSIIWFAHKLVTVWLFTATPKGVAPFRTRGWTEFEAAAATLSSYWGGCVLDLDRCESGAQHVDRGWPRNGAAVAALVEASRANPDGTTFHACELPRMPPATPKAFAKSLEGKVFAKPGDAQLLLQQYSDFFHAFAGHIEVLNFAGLEWGDLEVERVADALPNFRRLRDLSLAGNEITEIGAGFLAEEIPACPSLRRLFLTENEIYPGLEGSERLIEAWATAGKDAFWLLLSFPKTSEYVRRKAGLDDPF